MVRSRWIKAVMATVVSTGLAWGQSGVPTPAQAPDDPTGRIITVNEAGKPPQKCRGVKSSVDEKGRKVLQVESLDTHEVMTIVTEGVPVMGEAPGGGHTKTLRTQIFHWGRHEAPPVAVATTAPCPSCAPTTGSWGAPAVANCDTCKPGTWTAPGNAVAGPAVTADGHPATTVGAAPKEVKVTQAEPSLLDKWRESWGKGDKPKAPAVETVKTSEPVKKPAPEVAKLPEPKKEVVEVKPAPPPHVDANPKKPDPLLSDPTQYSKRPVDEKLPAKTNVPPTDLAKLPGAGEPLGAGSKSVTDSGMVTKPGYPVATLPPMNMGGPPPRPPRPVWNVPQAPQPVPYPGRNTGIESNQGGIAYNAFTPYEHTPPAPGSAAQGQMGNAFSTDTDPRPAPGVFGPGCPPPGMTPPPGYGPATAGMLPPTPYGPVVRLQGSPTPPNPTGAGPQLAMLPRNTGVQQTGYQAPAAPASGMSAQQLTGMLRDSLYPSQREWAADKLSALDWKQNEAAILALAKAVGEDPAPTVRAACVRALARMKADSYAVVSAVQAAKK
ncbi:MAG TPA: hypothetical protein VFW33_22785, partial [Gemmataceae bacterium]|nr:hypothetical protein [Gemmataceae bacterium]